MLIDCCIEINEVWSILDLEYIAAHTLYWIDIEPRFVQIVPK